MGLHTLKGGGSTAEHSAAERRQAARTLLNRPVLHSGQDSEELALVHRHSMALTQMFRQQLGYRLIVEASFARLLKSPDAALAGPARRVHSGPQTVVSASVYPLVCLAVAALLAPGIGSQILISHLVEQIRRDAVTIGSVVTVDRRGRQALARALMVLLRWGVLIEQDGSVDEWNAHEAEGLLNINRPLLPFLLAQPVPVDDDDLCQMWAADSSQREEPRQSLRRKLVENPVVRREELSEAEREVLSRNRSELARQLQENFGLGLEVRLEGVAAFDTEGFDGALSDEQFPGQGTVRQAALLLTDRLVADAQPESGCTAQLDGHEMTGLLCSWPTIEQTLGALVDQHGAAWAAKFVGNPTRLRRAVVELLESMSLATAGTQGLVLHPAVGRYRPCIGGGVTRENGRPGGSERKRRNR